MKDWIDHQKTSLHLGRCKLLREQYPEWDGKVTPLQSDAIKGSKIPPLTSDQTFQDHHKKSSDGSLSRSRSHSPSRPLKVKGENGARGHGHCTAPGLGLDLSLRGTTAIFSPIIRNVQVLVRDCLYEKEGIRNLAHQERALSYSRLLGQKMRNRGHQGRAVSKDHPQVQAENKFYRGVMKNSAQEGAPIKSFFQEVKRDRVHEDGAVSDDVCQERAVSDICHQEELVTNNRHQ
ncbi:hypothetical protein CRENBAI_016478 [Crenichthys baileyi]|uniref:Uncharacterized protein n=1 Tax=Crenichthys baileyi TaxID=28760 RepID=A0AAV9SB60_9TELE